MPFTSLANRLHLMPLILCGPILRRVEPKEVTVWVALKEEKKVWLEVYEDISGADPIPNLKKILAGARKPIKLGDNLFIVAVTATLIPGEPDMRFGKIYFYNLFLTDPNATSVAVTDPDLKSNKVITSEIHYAHEPEDLGPHAEHVHLPSFCLPPDDLNQLRIVHGSCRKAHAEGLDAMPGIDDMIISDRFTPEKRPHYLLLTGDQFYADDVSPIMLFLLMDAERSLFNSVEDLPTIGVPAVPDVHGDNFKFFTGVRKDVGGFTSHELNHLATTGEYMSYYLFMWSDVLWLELGDEDLPGFERVRGSLSSYRSDKESLNKFRSGLRKVKRAMANVPTYMIFDDHDVTDDWYMTYHWCKNVLNNELGRRMVMNGLLAYALFQDWGNKPDQYVEQVPAGTTKPGGTKLLPLAEKWLTATGSRRAKSSVSFSASDEPEIQKLLGLPPGMVPATIFRKEHGRVVINQQDPDAIRWFFVIQRKKYEIRFLDGRTRRAYPDPGSSGEGIEHGDIISFNSLKDQIGSDEQDLKDITMIVAPTSVIAIPAIELNEFPIMAELAARLEFMDKYNLDVFDHWKNQSPMAEKILSLMAERNAALPGSPASKKQSRILILTGDVHFSAVSRMQYEGKDHKAVFAQIISSSFKKQDYKTRILHQVGYKFGNVSALVLGDFFLLRLPEKIRELANSNNIALKVLGLILSCFVLVLTIIHVALMILDRLLQILDQTILKDWFNEKGAQPRHFLGWDNPKQKENIQQLRIPFPIEAPGTTPVFERIELTTPYVVSSEVLEKAVEPKLKFPDWQYRIDFMIADNEVRGPADDPAIEPLTAPSPGDRKQALAQYLRLAKNHAQYAKKWGNGKEIVGVNNISEVFFQWNNADRSVTQETWWRLQGNDGEMLKLFPLSKYKVSLNFDDPKYPVPALPVP